MRWRGSTIPISNACVVINNTPDPALWRPVEEHCRALGERFKFVRVEKLAGYKAGALRLALAHTAPDAEIIGVIDADYVVDAGLAQGSGAAVRRPARRACAVAAGSSRRRPLAHASRHERRICRLLRYRHGAAQRGQRHHRARHDVPASGARRIESAGGWSSDTIVEDTDLGLRILERGWLAHYTNRRYGYGLLPDTFDAYKRQRHRWAFGGLQIVRKHWRHLLPWRDGLSREQKREYGLGWLNWLGAESIGVVVALLNIVWVPVVAFANIAVPDRILTLPILAAFVVSVAHFAALYRLRVRVPAGQMLGAVFAAMSMQWTVARAVGIGRAQGAPAVPAHRQGRRHPQGSGLPGLLGSGDRRAPADRRR